MASVFRSLTPLFLIAFIFSFIPRPTTSFPIIVLERTKGPSSLTSSSSIIIIDGPQIFGIAFALGKPVSHSISHRGPVLTYVKRGFLRYFVPGHGPRIEWPLTALSTESSVGFFHFKWFLPSLMPHFLGLLAAPANMLQQLSHIAQQLSYIEQQLSYLRFATIIRVATATILDADDIRRPVPRRGGSANPVSSAPRPRSQWARFRGGGQGMRGGAGRTGSVPIAFTSPV